MVRGRWFVEDASNSRVLRGVNFEKLIMVARFSRLFNFEDIFITNFRLNVVSDVEEFNSLYRRREKWAKYRS